MSVNVLSFIYGLRNQPPAVSFDFADGRRCKRNSWADAHHCVCELKSCSVQPVLHDPSQRKSVVQNHALRSPPRLAVLQRHDIYTHVPMIFIFMQIAVEVSKLQDARLV